MLEPTHRIKICPAIRPKQVAQGFILSGLENLQGWSLYNFSGQTAWLLDCPHGEKDFPKCSLNLCCFNLSPLSLVIPPYNPAKSMAPPSWSLHHMCWNAAIMFPWSFLFSTLNRLLFPQPLFTGACCSFQPSCSSSAELTPIDWCPSVLGGPKLDVVFYIWSNNECWVEADNHFPRCTGYSPVNTAHWLY